MATTDTHPNWKSLDVAVIGGGIGGLAVAVSLRRAGHKVTIYERADFAGEVGASISCAANGTQWLREWGVDISKGKPVILEKLIAHEWSTGEVDNVYDLKDYVKTWGNVYNMFHRVNMHEMLMESAIGEQGEGIPAVLKVNHKCKAIELDSGLVTFENGNTAKHDLVIGADGIGSTVRSIIGIHPDKKQSDSTCYHCIIGTSEVKRLGLHEFAKNNSIEYWGGIPGQSTTSINKIVFSPCRNGEINSFYCFFPTDKSDHAGEGWNYSASVGKLLAPYPDLDPRLLEIFKHCTDIKPWSLFNHQPYPYWTKGRVAIMGDAAHPMMPDQSQGACMAIEDAAALGVIFSRRDGLANAEKGGLGVTKGLELYQAVRHPRATRVQAASARARVNTAERIGFSANPSGEPTFKVADEKTKLTIEEMNMYQMKEDVATKSQAISV